MAWPTSVDYNEAIQSPDHCFDDADLKAAEVACNQLGLPAPCTGNFADVYRLTSAAGRSWAVKCFTREVPDLQDRYRAISSHLDRARQRGGLPFLVEFRYLDKGIRVRGKWHPALKMDWVQGEHLNAFVQKYLDKPKILSSLGAVWLRLCRDLRAADMAHGDLQNGNVLLVPGEKANTIAPRLIDYDGTFVPALAGSRANELGHPNFQHPRRQEDPFHPRIDDFSHLVIYAAVRCLAAGGRSLWERHDNGEGLLFKKQDFDAPASSELFRELWRTGEPEARALVGHLVLACQSPPRATPRLDELLGSGDAALSQADAGRVDAALGVRRTRVEVTAPPPPIPFMPEPPPAPRPDWMAAAPPPVPASVVRKPAPPPPLPEPEPPKRKKGSGCPECGSDMVGRIVACECGYARWGLFWWLTFTPVALTIWAAGAAFAGRAWFDGCAVTTVVATLVLALLLTAYAIKGGVEIARAPRRDRPPAEVLLSSLVGVGGAVLVSSCCCGLPSMARVPPPETESRAEVEKPPARDAGKDARPKPPEQKKAEPLTGPPVLVLRGHAGAVNAVSFGDDGDQLATAGEDGTALSWDARRGQILQKLLGHKGKVNAVAFERGGSLVATGGDDKSVRLWDSRTGAAIRSLPGHTREVTTVAFSPDKLRLASAGMDKTVRIWSLQGGQLASLTGHAGPVGSLAYDADGQRLVSGGDDRVLKLWDARAGIELRTFRGHTEAVGSVAFAPGGRSLASVGLDGTVKTWLISRGDESLTIKGHRDWVRAVAYSRDGTRLATGGDDKTVRVWDVADGRELAHFVGHDGWVTGVSFDATGERLASSSRDGTVRVWDVSALAAKKK